MRSSEDERMPIPCILDDLRPLVTNQDPHQNIQLSKSNDFNLVAVVVANSRKYSSKLLTLRSLLHCVAPLFYMVYLTLECSWLIPRDIPSVLMVLVIGVSRE